MGWVGSAFTWSDDTSTENRKATHLDKVLCDEVWGRLFSTVRIRHLTHSWFNHCPLLLQMGESNAIGLGDRPFKIQAVWILHEDFFSSMKDE